MKKITLKNLEKSTAQQVFDFIASSLLKQNEKSSTGGTCKYRAFLAEGKTLCCAAGFILTEDEAKTFDKKGSSWYTLTLGKKVPEKHKNLIFRLQHIHDATSPSMWKQNLIKLANDEKLKTTVLK